MMKNNNRKELDLLSFFKIDLVLFIVCLTVPFASTAQTNDVAKSHVSNKYKQCMHTVDMDAIQRRQNEASKIDDEVKQLCQSKLRNKAQNLATDLALKLHESKEVSRYRYCLKRFYEPQKGTLNLMQKYHVTKLRYVHTCDS